MYFNSSNINPDAELLLDMPLPASLPPSYIETAQFDCLHDEGIMFATRLKSLGVPVTLYQTEETIHGFDAVDCSITRTAQEKHAGFIRQNMAAN